MIVLLYGDEHAAAAYVAASFIWAKQDHYEIHRGNRAHPLNIPFGYGFKLARLMHSGFHSAVLQNSTVDDIIRNWENQIKSIESPVFVASWAKSHLGERNKIEQFGDRLIAEKIPACFINSNHNFDSDHPLWLWKPNKLSLINWATKNQILNKKGFLDSYGHTLLANLVLKHLTKQLTVTIIEE